MTYFLLTIIAVLVIIVISNAIKGVERESNLNEQLCSEKKKNEHLRLGLSVSKAANESLLRDAQIAISNAKKKSTIAETTSTGIPVTVEKQYQKKKSTSIKVNDRRDTPPSSYDNSSVLLFPSIHDNDDDSRRGHGGSSGGAGSGRSWSSSSNDDDSYRSSSNDYSSSSSYDSGSSSSSDSGGGGGGGD